MRKKWNYYIPELLFLFVLSFLPLWWMRDGGIVLGHDSAITLKIPYQILNQFNAWSDQINMGTEWPYLRAYLPMNIVELIMTNIFTFEIGQKILFVGWFFLIAVSMYVFVGTLFPDYQHRIIRITAPVFYTVNFFLFEVWFIADRPKFSYLVLLPISLLIVHNVFVKRGKLLRNIGGFFLVLLFFNCAGLPPLLGSYAIGFSLIMGLFTLREILIYRLNGFKRVVLFIFGVSVSLLFSQAYWLIPFIFYLQTGYTSSISAIGGIDGTIAWEKMVSTNASILNLVRLVGSPNWIGESAYSYASPYLQNPLLIGFSLIPIVCICIYFLYFLFLGKKILYRTWMLSFFLLLGLGIFLASGTHPPTGVIYELLMRHIPGFAVFRSSYYKFMPLVIFSMSILFSVGIYSITNKLLLIKKNLLVIFITLILFFVYHLPIFLSSPFTFTWGFSTLIEVPNYAFEMANTINVLPLNSKVLIVPELKSDFINTPTDTYTWGYYSLESFPWLLSERPIISNGGGAPEIISAFLSAIKNNNIDQINSINNSIGITHILFRKDIELKSENETNELIEEWNKILTSSQLIKQINQHGKWVLYEIPGKQFISLYPALTYIDAPKDTISYAIDIASNQTAVTYSPLQTNINENNEAVIWRAICLLCKINEFNAFIDSIDISAYKPRTSKELIITQEEELLYQNPKLDYGARIDMNLAFTSRILNSITKQTLLDQYKLFMNDSLSSIEKLSDYQKNVYITRLLAFITKQKKYLLLNHADSSTSEFIPFMDSVIEYLDKNIIKSIPDKGIYKYYVNIPHDDLVEIVVKDIPMKNVSVYLDGEFLPLLNNINISQGVHEIEVRDHEYSNKPKIPAVFLHTTNPNIFNQIQTVDYERISSGEYQITLNPSQENKIISFPVTYHNGWVLIKGHHKKSFTRSISGMIDLFFSKYEKMNANHIELFGFSNGWILPQHIEEHEFTILFLPQRFIPIGFLLTLLATLIVGCYLMYTLFTYKKTPI